MSKPSISSSPFRILVGRGVANPHGFTRLIAASDVGRPLEVGIHHLERPSDQDVEYLDSLQERTSISPDLYVDECLRVAREWKADVYWPVRELESFSARAGEFAALGVVLMVCGPLSLLERLEDKLKFSVAARSLGVLAPVSIPFNDLGGFDRAYAAIIAGGDRVCFKPKRGAVALGLRVVREGLDLFDDLFDDRGYRLNLDDTRRRFGGCPRSSTMLAMPWLSGAEWSVDCVQSTNGAGFWGVARGKAVGDVHEASARDNVLYNVLSLSRILANGLHLRGLFNCQFKFHRGEAYVIEINAGPAGGMGLSELTGVNLPELALRDALGLEPRPQPKVTPVRAVFLRRWSSAEDRTLAPDLFELATGERGSARLVVVDLQGGTTRLSQLGGKWPVGQLLGVAERRGARRPFLLVSKVLGKHLPVTPGRMEASYSDLAADLAIDLPGPVLFVGMAETATGLGWGVYESWARRAQRDDALYIHSTRYLVHGHPTIAFEEAHSHAPEQAICLPSAPELRALFSTARTLVVVDDELSSGKTAAALATALRAFSVPLERLVAVSLIAAYPEDALAEGGALFGWEIVSLSRISVEFIPNAAASPARPLDQRAIALSPSVGSTAWGRTGAKSSPAVPPALVGALAERLRGQRLVYVLGSGECMHPAWLLARSLEALGHVTLVQSTTRSPIELGGAISATLDCIDGLGSGVPFYLHNPPRPGSGVVVLHERGAANAVMGLSEVLGALSVEVWDA